jgi:hypothetical protein
MDAEGAMSLDMLPAFSLDFDPAALLTVESGDNDDFLRWLETSMLPEEPAVGPADPVEPPIGGVASRQSFPLASTMSNEAMPIKTEPAMQAQPDSSRHWVAPIGSTVQHTQQNAGFRTSNAAQAPFAGTEFQDMQASQRPEDNFTQKQQPGMAFPAQQHAQQQLYGTQTWKPPFMQHFQQQQQQLLGAPFVFQGMMAPQAAPAPAPLPPDPPKKMGPARRFR